MSDGVDPLAPFEPLLDALADRIVDRWLASTATRMVAQAGSPLGSYRHRLAVKRRMKNGEGGATIVGRRHLLTHEALQEELGLKKRKSPEPDREPPPDDDPPAGPDAAAFARQLLSGLSAIRAPKKGGPR